MPQFQGSQFTPLFARKHQQEAEQKDYIGKQFAGEVAGGIQQEIQNRQKKKMSQYDMALGMIKDRFKVSEPYYVDGNKALSFQEQLELADNIASGKYGSKFRDKEIGWQPVEAEKKSRSTELVPSKDTIDQLNKYLPNMNWQVGVPKEIEVSTYEKYLGRLGKERVYKLREKKLQMEKLSSKGSLTDKDILRYWKDLTAKSTDPYLDEDSKKLVNEEMVTWKPFYDNVIKKTGKRIGGTSADPTPAGASAPIADDDFEIIEVK